MFTTKNQADEHAIFLCLQHGDERAFDYLFHKYYPVILFFIRRILPDIKDAEEVAQDIFFKAWEKHRDFDSLYSFKGFLYTAARNASINLISKNRNRIKYHEDYASKSDKDETPILRAIIRSEVLSELSHGINGLPEQCRNIMRMIFEEEMDAKEVAKELNISVSTVNSQKARGLSLLRVRLSHKSFDLLLLTLFFSFML